MTNSYIKPISTLLEESDLVKCPNFDDPLEERIKILEEENNVLKGELRALLADIQKFKIFSDGTRIDQLEEDFSDLQREVSKLRGARQPGSKQSLRIAKLDQILLTRNNSPITFSETGKILELGSRSPDGKRSTRRQNMTLFGKTLESMKDRYVVFDSKTQNGKMVKLTREYFQHLMRLNQGV